MNCPHSCSSPCAPFISPHLPQHFFFSSGVCSLRWQAAMTAPLISAGGPGVQVGLWSQASGGGGRRTHLFLLTAVSRPALWKSFIPQPHALLSAMGWHRVQSHTCSPLLSLVSLLSGAMPGIPFCFNSEYSLHLILPTLFCLPVSLQRQGRCDTFATEFDLEAEEYVPLPKGDVHKKKEIVQDVTLHDLDVANARPQVCKSRCPAN